MAQEGGRPSERVPIQRCRDGRTEGSADLVAAEEPLEIRLGGERVAVTMRTPGPGEDIELAVGFLSGEGMINPADVATVREFPPRADGGVVDVILREGVVPAGGWQRNFYATSSCGVCGKASIEAIRVTAPAVPDGPVVASEVISSLPDALRARQRLFDRTGGLHAAGLFTADGELLVLREDVGRHNAVDKAIGRALLRADVIDRVAVLQVSGRASFELVQKALVAGIPIVTAVSAPSSLAVRLAREANMTLIGFLRESGYNVYSGEGRIAASRTLSSRPSQVEARAAPTRRPPAAREPLAQRAHRAPS
jgi:FdhD protein